MDAIFAPTKRNRHHSSKLKSKRTNQNLIKWATFLLPIVLAFIFLSLKIWAPETYLSIVQEDTAIEWVQALFYFLAGGISAFACLGFFKRKLKIHGILYGLLALGLVFIALEEISWGQRILGIENTDFFNQYNTQKEISLHNLEKVQNQLAEAYILIGLYGASAWIFASKIKLIQNNPSLKYFIPDWYVSSYFFFVLFIYSLISHIRPFAVEQLGIEQLRINYFLIHRDQEPPELLLSLGFLVFAGVKYFRLQKMKEVPAHLTTGFAGFKDYLQKKAEPGSSDRKPMPASKPRQLPQQEKQAKKES